jgi:hypothetical protein
MSAVREALVRIMPSATEVLILCAEMESNEVTI